MMSEPEDNYWHEYRVHDSVELYKGRVEFSTDWMRSKDVAAETSGQFEKAGMNPYIESREFQQVVPSDYDELED